MKKNLSGRGEKCNRIMGGGDDWESYIKKIKLREKISSEANRLSSTIGGNRETNQLYNVTIVKYNMENEIFSH